MDFESQRWEGAWERKPGGGGKVPRWGNSRKASREEVMGKASGVRPREEIKALGGQATRRKPCGQSSKGGQT